MGHACKMPHKRQFRPRIRSGLSLLLLLERSRRRTRGFVTTLSVLRDRLGTCCCRSSC
jgi:hypothetical protein